MRKVSPGGERELAARSSSPEANVGVWAPRDMIRARMASLRQSLYKEPAAGWARADTGICLALPSIFLASSWLWIAANPQSSAYREEAHPGPGRHHVHAQIDECQEEVDAGGLPELRGLRLAVSHGTKHPQSRRGVQV